MGVSVTQLQTIITSLRYFDNRNNGFNISDIFLCSFQDNVAEMCVQYFERFRRQTHVTPKSYLSFLGGYKGIYKMQHEAIGQLAKRMNTGLAKLVEASESVAKLSEELVVKEKELAVASKKADVVLQEVTVSATAAEKVKSQVQKVKDKAQAIVDDIAVSLKLTRSQSSLILSHERRLGTSQSLKSVSVTLSRYF